MSLTSYRIIAQEKKIKSLTTLNLESILKILCGNRLIFAFISSFINKNCKDQLTVNQKINIAQPN